MNHLIITADDFGLSEPVNEAVEIAHGRGILSAASLMVAAPAAADAVARARRMPRLRVGLHVVLLEEAAAAPAREIDYLIDERGLLRADVLLFAIEIALWPFVRRQLAREIRAQFEAFRATGLPLDHVNAHKHFHLHPFIGPLLIAEAARYGARALRVPAEPAMVLARIEQLPTTRFPLGPWLAYLRRAAARGGLLTPDAVFGLAWSGAMTSERLAGLLRELPKGVIEIYLHPATADHFAGSAMGYRYSEELAALTDPTCIELLRRCGHRLGGYSDALVPNAPVGT